MLRRFTVLTVAALLFATPVMAAEFKSSEDFVHKAAIGNMFEIKSSKLALKRSQDPDVRAFAQQMITDHTKAGTDLKGALTDSKMSTKDLPTKLDTVHQAEYTQLAKAKPGDFNADYIAAQKKAHTETIDLFESYANNGDNTTLKNFVTNTLPTLKMHQEHVDKLADKK